MSTASSPRRDARLVPVGAVAPVGSYIAEAWQRRDFALNLAIADVRANNVNSLLGNLWHLLNPLLLVGVYYLIFGVVFDLSGRGGVDNYLGFLVIGVFLFTFTRKSTVVGARAIVNNRSLLQNIRFPRVLLPVSSVLSEFLAFVPSLVVILFVERATGEMPTPMWLLLVPIVIVQTVFNLGLSMVAARLTVHVRDFEQLLPFLLRLWFYLSGVLYPVDRIGEALSPFWREVFEANPAYVYIDLARQAMMQDVTSSKSWILAIAWAVVALVGGFVYFRGHELEYGNV